MYRTIRIIDIIEETSKTKTFVFQFTDDIPTSYKPGQFITLVFPHRNGEDRRSFSLSSLPGMDAHAAFTVKRIDNGAYSRKLVDHTVVGDEIQTSGITGFFTLPDTISDYKQIVFMAAGSGITPVYALIKSLRMLHPQVKIVLLYSNRSVSDTIFYNSLLQLQADAGDNFTIEFLFSNNKHLSKARLNVELLNLLLRQYIRPPYNDTLCYLCGPYDYMQMITITLKTAGIPAENIRKELFDIVKPAVTPQPPDRDVHHVTIQRNGQTYKFPVQYPVSVLAEAKRRHITLPYSCESGSCGACAATCISGVVWMSYNDVLTDSEQAKGRILTCTGFPVGGDVELIFQ